MHWLTGFGSGSLATPSFGQLRRRRYRVILPDWEAERGGRDEYGGAERTVTIAPSGAGAVVDAPRSACRPGSVPQPRAHLARVQPPRAARGGGRAHAAARAREVPRHLGLEPRRVLHEAHRRPEAAGRRRVAGAHRGRPHAGRADRRRVCRRARLRAPATRPVERTARSAARRARHPDPVARRARRRRAGGAARALRAQHLPAGDAAGARPGASVPVHLQPVAQPARRRPPPEGERAAADPRQGAGRQRHPALRPRRRFAPLRAASRTSSPRTSTCCCPA